MMLFLAYTQFLLLTYRITKLLQAYVLANFSNWYLFYVLSHEGITNEGVVANHKNLNNLLSSPSSYVHPSPSVPSISTVTSI